MAETKKVSAILNKNKPIKRNWLKMGVELEGSWNLNWQDVAAGVRGARAKTDGSVGDGGRLPGFPGEIITRPWEELDGLCGDVTVLWPNHINHTCGFHIHTSFSDIDTSRLADTPFWEYFLDRWEEWGNANAAEMTSEEAKWFWDRLEMKSDKAKRYCKREFMPEKQLIERNRDYRYTALNFLSWHQFKTVECRFLPMFHKPPLALKAIRELSSIYDTWLSQTEFPDIKLDSELLEAGGMVIEAKEMLMNDLTYLEEDRPCHTFKKVVTGPDIQYYFRDVKFIPEDAESENLHEP